MLTWVKVVGLTILVLTLFCSCLVKNVYTGEQRDFNSVAELELFLLLDKTDQHEYIPETYDCDDFAIDLMLAAEAQGYRMNVQFDFQIGHAFNSVIIDGMIYLIEPQNDAFYLFGPLDETENPSEEGLPAGIELGAHAY